MYLCNNCLFYIFGCHSLSFSTLPLPLLCSLSFSAFPPPSFYFVSSSAFFSSSLNSIFSCVFPSPSSSSISFSSLLLYPYSITPFLSLPPPYPYLFPLFLPPFTLVFFPSLLSLHPFLLPFILGFYSFIIYIPHTLALFFFSAFLSALSSPSFLSSVLPYFSSLSSAFPPHLPSLHLPPFRHTTVSAPPTNNGFPSTNLSIHFPATHVSLYLSLNYSPPSPYALRLFLLPLCFLLLPFLLLASSSISQA